MIRKTLATFCALFLIAATYGPVNGPVAVSVTSTTPVTLSSVSIPSGPSSCDAGQPPFNFPIPNSAFAQARVRFYGHGALYFSFTRNGQNLPLAQWPELQPDGSYLVQSQSFDGSQAATINFKAAKPNAEWPTRTYDPAVPGDLAELTVYTSC